MNFNKRRFDRMVDRVGDFIKDGVGRLMSNRRTMQRRTLRAVEGARETTGETTKKVGSSVKRAGSRIKRAGWNPILFAFSTIRPLAIVTLFSSISCVTGPVQKWNLPSELLHTQNGATLSSDEDIRAALESMFLDEPSSNLRDVSLEREVRLALVLNSALIGQDVTAWVEQGVVHLVGEVDSDGKKRLAGEIAASSSKRPLVVRNSIHIGNHS